MGEGNYRYFLGFLFTTSLLCAYAMIVAVSILATEIRRDGLLTGMYYNSLGDQIPASYSVAASYLVQRQPSFMFILLLSMLMSVALGGFLLHHCYLASYNITSYERVKRMDQLYLLENSLADHPDQSSTLTPQMDSVSRNSFHKGFLANWLEVFQ